MRNLFVLLVFILISNSCGSIKSTAEQEFNKFIAEYRDVKKAIKPYQQFNVEYLLAEDQPASKKHVSPKEYAEAINMMVESLGEYPFNSSDNEACEAALKKLLNQGQNSLAWYLKSVLIGRGRIGRLMDTNAIDKAIKLSPNIGDYYLERASIYQRQKQYQMAVNDYHTALKLHSDRMVIQQQLLHLYQTTRNEVRLFYTYRIIIRDLQDSISHLHPEQNNALHSQVFIKNLSTAYVSEAYDFIKYNRPDSAKASIQKALRLRYVMNYEDKQEFENLPK